MQEKGLFGGQVLTVQFMFLAVLTVLFVEVELDRPGERSPK